MSVQSIYQKHCIGYRTCPNLRTGIPQQCLSCRFKVLVNFGEVFALFFFAFIVDFKYLCLLRMSLNATLQYIFMEHQIDVIFMGVIAKHQFATVPLTSSMWCSSQRFVYKLLGSFLIFIMLLQFSLGKPAQFH